MCYTWENRSLCKISHTFNMGHALKNVPFFGKFVKLGKMGHTWVNEGHTWENGLHFGKWVALEKMSHNF